MKEGKQKFLIFLYPLPPLKRLEDQKFLDEVRTGQPPSSQGVEKQLDALHRVLVEKPLRDPKIIKSAQEAKAQVDEIIKGIIASSGLSKKEIGAIDYKLMLAEKPAGTPDGAKVLWNAEERYSITIAEHADGSWGAPGPNEMKCWQAAR